MKETLEAIDSAIREVKALRGNLKKKNQVQIRSASECSLVKATALSWLNSHRKIVATHLKQESLDNIDHLYTDLLKACDRSTAAKLYDKILKALAGGLTKIKGDVVQVATQGVKSTIETPPNFSSFTSDIQMQTILNNRWAECHRCILGEAPLAATVMMGGFLESLLLARINMEADKSKIFKAKGAPKEPKTGNTLPLKEWTLRGFIDVAHELKWISQSAKDVGEVLRDFRNFIHPSKQLSHNVNLSQDDATLFWEITKSISRQLLR